MNDLKGPTLLEHKQNVPLVTPTIARKQNAPLVPAVVEKELELLLEKVNVVYSFVKDQAGDSSFTSSELQLHPVDLKKIAEEYPLSVMI